MRRAAASQRGERRIRWLHISIHATFARSAKGRPKCLQDLHSIFAPYIRMRLSITCNGPAGLVALSFPAAGTSSHVHRSYIEHEGLAHAFFVFFGRTEKFVLAPRLAASLLPHKTGPRGFGSAGHRQITSPEHQNRSCQWRYRYTQIPRSRRDYRNRFVVTVF